MLRAVYKFKCQSYVIYTIMQKVIAKQNKMEQLDFWYKLLIVTWLKRAYDIFQISSYS